MQKRAWEEDDPATPPQRRPRQHDWESDSNDGEGFPDHADSSSDSEAEAEPETMLLRTLMDLLFLRVLNARQFCVVLYWCGRCGLAALAQFGRAPGAKSHHYQRHLESKLGVVFNDRGRFYNLKAPGKLKQTGGRHVNDMTMSAVWEEIDTDMRADPSSRMRVEEYLNDDLAPPSNPTHPVVLRHAPYLVALYDLFIDGVPYSLTDSVIGIWIIIAHTGKRHLVGAIRKKLICDGGCRGWCSFFLYLASCILSLASSLVESVPVAGMMNFLGAQTKLSLPVVAEKPYFFHGLWDGSKGIGRNMREPSHSRIGEMLWGHVFVVLQQ